MKPIFVLLFLLVSFPYIFSQKAFLKELKDSNRVQLDLHFYPSTLRMLNIQKDTAYDKLIEGVEKLSFFMLRSDKFSHVDYNHAIHQLTEEGFEEYMVMDNKDYKVQILGKPTKEKMLGLANYEEKFYIFHLEGTLDLMKLPDVYENITTQDSSLQNGFSYIFEIIDRQKK